MTLKLVAFGMPFVTLIFMSALAYGIARYNRRSQHRVQSGTYVIESSQLSWHFQDEATHRH
jgi:hypothetical protein